jgi:alcohol dehydrogenase
MIDLDNNRLEVAKRLGATETINNARADAVKAVRSVTAGWGVDTAIEVGIPATFGLCEDLVAPTIANINVRGTKVDLHLERLWDRNITITARLVDTVSRPLLLSDLGSKKINAKVLNYVPIPSR